MNPSSLPGWLPPLVVQPLRKISRKVSSGYYRISGRKPFTRGYYAYKQKYIDSVLHNSSLLLRFHEKDWLPPRYGLKLDERCVEFPWVYSQLTPYREILLDAGSTLNQDYLLRHPILLHKEIHILTLATEEHFFRKGLFYLYGDLRHIPIRDNTYDTVVCISTLEHIGCDNREYTGKEQSKENRPDDFCLAMKEFRRVLKTGGRLLLTVPYGKYAHFGIQQVFDAALLQRAMAAFGAFTSVDITFYQYRPEGWTISTAEGCANCEYARGARYRPVKIFAEPDGAVAARAVACMQMVK